MTTLPTPKITPTPQQQAIIAAIPDPRSQMLEAMAGTAKTTTLRLAAAKVRKPALALAFNKKIADELAATFPGNFTCKSLNAWGFAALRRSGPTIRWNVDGSKLAKLIKLVVKDHGMSLSGEEWDMLRRLVGAGMASGRAPRDVPEAAALPGAASWSELAAAAWVPEESAAALIDLAEAVLTEDLRQVLQGTVSFDDQIWAPLVLGVDFVKFPVLFGDEVQDWNALNHEMVRRSLQPKAKLVLAGDSRQSIYAFRGACSDSMARARALAPEWIDQPLTLTFRCPKAIVARQQEHAPGYEAASGNVKGRVVRLGGLDSEGVPQGWTLPELLDLAGTSQPAVLCRNNSPLLSLAFRLIRQRVSVVMLGRDIGKGLVALSKKIARADDTPAEELREKIAAWQRRELETLTLNDAEPSRLDSVRDRAECLLAVLDSAEVPDAGGLRRAIEDLFARDSGRVVLSTIHRAKGLEWGVVLHLDWWRVPGKRAREKGGAELQQELNLRYVCETRAKETLVLASLEDFE